MEIAACSYTEVAIFEALSEFVMRFSFNEVY